MTTISSLEELALHSEHGRFVNEILEFYVPLILQIPKLRDDPQFMREQIKALSLKGITDVVTGGDIYTQEVIRKEVLKMHPNWQFWGEEGYDHTFHYESDKSILVVTDPIEGTNNFKHHKDNQWGSVIGLVDIKTRKPIAGIIAYPTERIFYIGVDDVGAYELTYNENSELLGFSQMDSKPEFNEFTYNNSPHFNSQLLEQVRRFYNLGKVQPQINNSDELDRSRRVLEIHRKGNKYVFLDPESGALEAMKYRGSIFFKTSNEMAAVFVIIRELGGKITDAEGRDWRLGINNLIFARNVDDYDLLKEIYDPTKIPS